jgi:hypothetical protein
MVPVTTRRGVAVIELLIALPLALLLSGLAIQILLTQLRATRRVESRVHNLRELEHGAMVLASDVRAAAASDIEWWTDSSVVLQAPVLVGIVCAVPAAQVVDVITGDGAHPLRVVQFAPPQTGDRLVYGQADSALLGLSAALLDSVSVTTTVTGAAIAPSACALSPLRTSAGGAPWRLSVSAPLVVTPDVGSVVTLTRRTEWRSYLAGDQQHYLGRRDWNGVIWSVTQPVIGPLLSNTNHGFTVAVARADLTPLAAAGTDARFVQFQLRSARRRTGGTPLRDSLTVTFALRGGH